MNLVIDSEKFNKDNVFFQDAVKNNIIDDSKFMRLHYSNHLFTLNGIFILFNLSLSQIEPYFNKSKFIYNTKQNSKVIQQLKHIEESILDKMCIHHKTQQYKLYEQLNSGHIKLFREKLSKNYTNYEF